MFTIPNQVKQLAEHFDQFGFEVRVAGGAVRDLCLGKEPKDWDLCTTATPDQMCMVGRKKSLRFRPTGIEHGTITFHIDKMDIEITTLRVDNECDGRHAKVEFTTDWHADAHRRDLTINSMMMDMEGNVFDCSTGMRDLNDFRLRFMGDPDKRIEEDYLRILRYFRMASKFPTAIFCAQLDMDATIAISKHSSKICDHVSTERIWSEFKQIMGHPNSIDLLDIMAATGVLDAIGFQLESPKQLKYTRINAKEVLRRGGNAITVIASMIDPTTVNIFTEKMKMSNEDANLLGFLVSNNRLFPRISEFLIKRFVAEGFNRDHVKQLAVMDHFCFVNFDEIEFPVFPVTGNDLIEQLGMAQGKALGDWLQQMKDRWINEEFTPTKQDLINMVGNQLK